MLSLIISPIFLLPNVLNKAILIWGLAVLSLSLIFYAKLFFSISKKDEKRGFNVKHSHLAGKFAIISFVLFWLIGLGIIFQDKINHINSPILGAFIVYFVMVPILILTFYGSPLILIYFAIKSFKEGKTIIRGGREILGSDARSQAIIYFFIGAMWLFMMLGFTYEVFICKGECGENNFFIRLWKILTEILSKALPV